MYNSPGTPAGTGRSHGSSRCAVVFQIGVPTDDVGVSSVPTPRVLIVYSVGP
ncbi:Uncharacterised protein [Mycobacteroides abscessus subsp. abscessus]|nr:Uncharacterised protein [Mycobacteroides abscessus subsp. abscessus]